MIWLYLIAGYTVFALVLLAWNGRRLRREARRNRAHDPSMRYDTDERLVLIRAQCDDAARDLKQAWLDALALLAHTCEDERRALLAARRRAQDVPFHAGHLPMLHGMTQTALALVERQRETDVTLYRIACDGFLNECDPLTQPH